MDLYFLSNTRWFYPNKLEALISYIITRVYYYKLSVSMNVNIDIIMLPRYKKNKNKTSGPSWLWSYGSWIYNYICNQCISPLTVCVRIPLMRGVLDTTLCDTFFQWLAAGHWFSPGTLVSSIKKTDRHEISEI
jgi:hypothetical protein